jgi:hypothetical protein
MSWRLWRQDDNGNRFPVGEYSRREEAEAHLSQLTRHPHKQIYWIEERPTANPPPPADE